MPVLGVDPSHGPASGLLLDSGIRSAKNKLPPHQGREHSVGPGRDAGGSDPEDQRAESATSS